MYYKEKIWKMLYSLSYLLDVPTVFYLFTKKAVSSFFSEKHERFLMRNNEC